MSASTKFIDLVMSGEVLAEEIDDYVEAWHESSSTEELSEYLGMSHDEYSSWVENPKTLVAILTRRRFKEDEIDWSGFHLMAARSQSMHNGEILMDWLKQKKYIN